MLHLLFNIAELLAHTDVDVEATVGNAFTITLPTAVLLQPEVEVPVTV